MTADSRAFEGTCRLVNPMLTYKLIELQQHGYEDDFILLKDYSVVCIQDKQRFDENDITITSAAQECDIRTGVYKFIFKVETFCGRKGILMVESVYRRRFKT